VRNRFFLDEERGAFHRLVNDDVEAVVGHPAGNIQNKLLAS